MALWGQNGPSKITMQSPFITRYYLNLSKILKKSIFRVLPQNSIFSRFLRTVALNSIVVEVVYHPLGHDNKDLMSYIQSTLDSILDSSPNASIILTGDFNHFNYRDLYSSF